MIHIALQNASDYDARHYGIIYRSSTLHTVTGPGVYNPTFSHEVTVWDNSHRPVASRGFLGPDGRVTHDQYCVTLSARASVIAQAAPDAGCRPRRGDALRIGDQVTLVTPDGNVFGTYVITARSMADPVLRMI